MAGPAREEELAAYLGGLSPRRVLLRSVDENRPVQAPGSREVVVGPVRHVEVVYVEGASRVARTFEGVDIHTAKRAPVAAGHTIIERNGNIT